MNPRLIEATYAGGYRIRLAYNDGTSGVVDLESERWGEMFEPLRARRPSTDMLEVAIAAFEAMRADERQAAPV